MSERVSPAAAPSRWTQFLAAVSSLGFWLLLLVAAGCFAAVTLAPKMLQTLRLRQTYELRQHQLVAMEDELSTLERVIEALEHDPAYAREMAQLDLEKHPTNEDVLPVEQELRLDPRTTATAFHVAPPPATDPWEPTLVVLATDTTLRTALLSAAATLLLAAFTFLHDGSRSAGVTPVPRVTWRDLWRQRYHS